MYLDASFKKVLVLGAVVLFLFVSVYLTYLGKMNVFGTTPYFYAINVGGKYIIQSFAASVASAGKGLYASAAAAFGDAPGTKITADSKAPGIPILTYHRIVEDASDENNVTIERFRDQMQTLHDAGWQTITLQEFEEYMAGNKELPEKSFLLTFDDGAKQSFYPVDPILKQLGYHAAIFIIVASSHTPESTYYLSPEEIQWLVRTGRWSIGSHSYDGHRPYSVALDGTTGIYFADKILNKVEKRLETSEEFTARVRDDLTRSKKELQETYGVPINTFAFPLGNESGVLGANNFAEGAAITEREAKKIYAWGFLQTNNQDFTLNFPRDASRLSGFPTTTRELASDFRAFRIHIDYDWDGARLLSLLENSRAKTLPYEDDFSENHGWIPAWGSLEIGRNNLQLMAIAEMTGVSTFLDGSALWDDYSFETSLRWQKGYAILLADVLHARSYHSCSFFHGGVRLQRTINGETTSLKEFRDPAITYSDTARMGIRVHDNVIECTWNFASVVEDYSRDFSGGIGIQTWDATPNNAAITVNSIIVRPYSGAE